MKNTNVIKLPLYKGYKTYWGAYCTDSKGKPFYILQGCVLEKPNGKKVLLQQLRDIGEQ